MMSHIYEKAAAKINYLPARQLEELPGLYFIFISVFMELLLLPHHLSVILSYSFFVLSFDVLLLTHKHYSGVIPAFDFNCRLIIE